MSDVDQLIEETSLEVVLQHYGLPLPEDQANEYRMNCVFDESCVDGKYSQLTVQRDAAKRIYCHGCEARGNLLTLIHGLERRCLPHTGRLRGQEFKDAVAKLRELAGGVANQVQDVIGKPQSGQVSPGNSAATHSAGGAAGTASPRKEQTAAAATNTPLRRHEKEAARSLADLYEELVVDVAEMSPEAAQYVRERRWLTAELMKEWGVGWIPGNGRSLFRKQYLVYTHRNERGEAVSYSGRNLSFEEKFARWLRDGRPDGKKLAKHRFVSGYHRGAELYGGHATRMQQDYVKESLQKYGVVVAEGMNEVLRMASLDVAAVGLSSNKATDMQVQKIVRFARAAGDNRVTLFPDCDDEGEAGFQSLLWRLHEERIHAKLGWSRQMFDGQFNGRQPESISDDEWTEIAATL